MELAHANQDDKLVSLLEQLQADYTTTLCLPTEQRTSKVQLSFVQATTCSRMTRCRRIRAANGKQRHFLYDRRSFAPQKGNNRSSHGKWLFCLVLLTLFSGNLFTFADSKSIEDPLHSLELAERDGTKTSTTTETIAPTSTVKSTIQELFDKVISYTTKSFQETTTPLPTTPPTTTTLTSSDTTTEEEYDTSSGNDDNDAEDCTGISNSESTETKNFTDNERLVNLQTCLQRKVKRRLVNTRRSGLELFEKLTLSGGCTSSLMNFATSLGDIKAFAFKFLDASAKIPSGMMNGLLSDFGDFDQCLSIRSNPSVEPENEAEENAYSGKYCLLSVKLNYHVTLGENETHPKDIVPDGVLWDELVRNYWTSKSLKGFQVGVCLPSRCDNEDIEQLYRHVAEAYSVKGELMSCQDSLDRKRQMKPDLIQLTIGYMFGIMIILSFIGTYFDRYHSDLVSKEETAEGLHKLVKEVLQVLVCFSIIKNWRTFMSGRSFSSSPNKNSMNKVNSFASSYRSRLTDVTSQGSSLSVGIDVESVPNVNTEPIFPNESQLNTEQANEKFGELVIDTSQETEFQTSEIDNSLSSLSGLKLIVIIWITAGHSFLYPSASNYQYYRSIIHMNITRDSVWFATTNFTLGIDMILYMAGLVFVHSIIQSSQYIYQATPRGNLSVKLKSDSKRLFGLILDKILRFWPTYMTVIAVAIVVPLLADGPMWPEMVTRRIGESCRKNWWANLLMINNFFSESEICLPSSWFISVLMQLFLIGSIIMLIIRNFSIQSSLMFIAIILMGTSSVSFMMAYVGNIRAPVITMDESFVMEMDDTIFRLYTNVINNVGPFLIGMAGGLLLVDAQLKEQRLKVRQQVSRSSGRKSPTVNIGLSKVVKSITEIISKIVVLTIAIVVLSSVFHTDYTRFWRSVYWSLHRVGWAIVTGYIIHNCVTGRWKLLNDFLSLSTFIPLSKLIFIAYLLYPIFIHMHSGQVRDGLHVSIYNMMNIFITRLVMTFTTALGIHLLVELPLISVEKLLLSRCYSQKSHQVEVVEQSRKFHPLLSVAPEVTLDLNKATKLKTEQQDSPKLNDISNQDEALVFQEGALVNNHDNQ